MLIHTLAEQAKFLSLADFSTARHEMFGLQLRGGSGDIAMVLPGMVVKNVTSSHDGRSRSVMYVSFSTARCIAAHATAKNAQLQFDQSSVYEKAYKDHCVLLLRQALGDAKNSELDFKAEKALLAETKKFVAAQEKTREARAGAKKVSGQNKARDSRQAKRKYDAAAGAAIAANKKAKSAAASSAIDAQLQGDDEALEREEENVKDSNGIAAEEELTAEEAEMVRACARAKLASEN
jgi:hypothetical protein